ncbi:MAG: DUF4157 domain-containing protein [Elainella sp. C42_A2020_010]|nr:DUF4157 domain-containing protein [Elainella sp. C42_A2020_010]
MTSQHAAQAKTIQSAQPAPQAPAPQKPTAHPLLHLQRQVGNQAATSIIQAKLTVGEPHDVYEQEADRVAAAVVNQIHAAPDQATQSALQTKPRIQRMSDVAGIAVSPDVESAIQQARGSGQPLDESIRVPMEQAFGADFSGVRVHADGESDRLARSIQARAFTTGQNIFFQPGEYQPTSRSGQELIAHELTHTLQQQNRDYQTSQSIQREIDKDTAPGTLVFYVNPKAEEPKPQKCYVIQLEESEKFSILLSEGEEISGVNRKDLYYTEYEALGKNINEAKELEEFAQESNFNKIDFLECRKILLKIPKTAEYVKQTKVDFESKYLIDQLQELINNLNQANNDDHGYPMQFHTVSLDNPKACEAQAKVFTAGNEIVLFVFNDIQSKSESLFDALFHVGFMAELANYIENRKNICNNKMAGRFTSLIQKIYFEGIRPKKSTLLS